MNRRILTITMAIALSTFAAHTASAAPLSFFGYTASNQPAQPKPISFKMRNDSAARSDRAGR